MKATSFFILLLLNSNLNSIVPFFKRMKKIEDHFTKVTREKLKSDLEFLGCIFRGRR